MFEKLRRPNKTNRKGRFKTIISYIVFGLICLVFVFLSPMSSQFFGEGVVAYVGSEPIRSREFRMVQRYLRFQYQKQFNKTDSGEYQKLEKQIRQSALQQLTSVYLISQAAEQSGFLISDEELQDEIKSYPSFQRKGRFVYSKYLSYLKSERLSPVRFESHIRRVKTSENWSNIFLKSISSNALEESKSNERDLYKVKLRFVEIPISKIEIEELEPLVFKKNLQQVNKFLRQNKITWKTSKEISPIDSFALPVLKDQDFMESFIDYLPKRGLIPRLTIKENKAYIVQVLSFKETPLNQNKKNAMFSSFLDYEKSNRLFNNWINIQKEQIPIKISLEP